MKRIIPLSLGICLLLASPCFAQMYTILEIDRIGIPTNFYLTPGGINGSGQAAYNLRIHAYSQAYRTDPNSATSYNLGSLSPALGRTIATSINESGQVAGTSQTTVNPDHAFRTAPNSAINPITDDLGALGIDSYGSAINDSGQVVGWGWVSGDYPNAVIHAFRTAPNSSINPITDDLRTLGGTQSYATSINGSGQVVGYSSLPGDTIIHGFRTSPNGPINATTDDIGTLGGSQAYAFGINLFGQVVGYSTTSGDAAIHAFRTAPNSSISAATDDLGTLGGDNSYGHGINAWGEVVGNSANNYSLGRAFLHSGGVMHDLNQFISADAGYLVYDAVAINDLGQILVSTSEPGNFPDGPISWRGIVLLTPIYRASVQRPINTDGTSVFSAKRGVIPVKFVVIQYGSRSSCTLPATISVTRVGNGTLASIDENTYSNAADSGSDFRIDAAGCQYVYNLAASRLGVGTYRVDISINGIMVGHAVFALK